VGGRTHRPTAERDKIQRQEVGSISEDCCGVNREAKKANPGGSIRSRHHTLRLWVLGDKAGSVQTAICWSSLRSLG